MPDGEFLDCNTIWHYGVHYTRKGPALLEFARMSIVEGESISNGVNAMSVFEKRREELEHYETMMGPHRGRLAVSLDLLTDAMILIGQHGIYCRSAANPQQPPMDMRLINEELQNAKQLIQSVMENLRAERDAREASGK